MLPREQLTTTGTCIWFFAVSNETAMYHDKSENPTPFIGQQSDSKTTDVKHIALFIYFSDTKQVFS